MASNEASPSPDPSLPGGLGGDPPPPPSAPDLSFTIDLYGGINITPSSIPDEPSLFESLLVKNLETWKSEGRRGIWVKIPASKASHVPVATSLGFFCHHANEREFMMARWLPDAPCTLPHNASHYVGVGIAVVDQHDRILVVQEKSGPAARGKDFWKVPTGLVDAGEDIARAAEREVLEETGIRVEFEGIIGFREQHNAGVERKTDIVFLCKARPLTSHIVKQDSELADCKWMPAHEFATLPIWPEGSVYWTFNRMCVEQALQGRGTMAGPRINHVPAFTPWKLPRGFGDAHTWLYSGLPQKRNWP